MTSQTEAVTTEIPLPVRLGNWVIDTSQFCKPFDRVRLAIALHLHNFTESPEISMTCVNVRHPPRMDAPLSICNFVLIINSVFGLSRTVFKI